MMLPLPPPPPPKVRPVFVLAVALIALPILVVFGGGMIADAEIDASTRLIMAPIYAITVFVAPVLLWRRLRSEGVPPSDAMAAALGLAVLGFALTLTMLVGWAEGSLGLVGTVALVLVIVVWRRDRQKKNFPRRPDSRQ
jgi:peptidoglycan/LPS O-acetylase OafA/YrhL